MLPAAATTETLDALCRQVNSGKLVRALCVLV